MMRKIRFLHVVKDDKFYHPVKEAFSKTPEISSEYVFFKEKKDSFKFINEKEVEVYENPVEFIKRLHRGNYDVLYLHSLQLTFYQFIRYIPEDVIVIWWAWGYDIYGQQVLGLDSFLNFDFFKPETQLIRKQEPFNKKLKRLYAKLFMAPSLSRGRKQMLSRVDYFQPVCSLDYVLMKEKAGLKAKELYLPMYGNFSTGEEKAKILNPKGAILIGNSAEYVQNHLDIWKSIREFIDGDQQILVPLSYGDTYYAGKVKQGMSDEIHHFNFLDSYLARDEYFALFENCSYAIFGSIRQHAMGNVYNALLRGMKVFFFSDSYVYKYLLSLGCVVFPLEEVDESSFTTPLAVEDQQQNYQALFNEQVQYRRRGTLCLEEIASRL